MNKYQDALNYLRNSVLVTDHKQKDRVNQCTELLQNLIHEHFDNPPLKFEELEVDMWVWDNAKKWWIKVLEIRVANNEDDVFAEGIKIIKLGYHVFNWQEFIFEENRFYRKQVEE